MWSRLCDPLAEWPLAGLAPSLSSDAQNTHHLSPSFLSVNGEVGRSGLLQYSPTHPVPPWQPLAQALCPVGRAQSPVPGSEEHAQSLDLPLPPQLKHRTSRGLRRRRAQRWAAMGRSSQGLEVILGI